MNEYRIELYDRDGNWDRDHIMANCSQEAADKIRSERKGCSIIRISMVVQDWE